MHNIKIECDFFHIAKVKRVIKTRLTLENWSTEIKDNFELMILIFKLMRIAQ